MLWYILGFAAMPVLSGIRRHAVSPEPRMDIFYLSVSGPLLAAGGRHQHLVVVEVRARGTVAAGVASVLRKSLLTPTTGMASGSPGGELPARKTGTPTPFRVLS